ncbi:hypothetical protein F53441_13071 [Fusarium austroafricanum]|uniref:Uncharacterized protein n=1 Tax=Fusarium austroafricanum TaxID=2364996 RepID=A0A8H4JUW6_9HYPO|nr:hypothetical protein F53441_13071 [Fusarium austroafricanum]
MQSPKSLILFLLTAALVVNAETTSCVTSTRAFPTVTTTIIGQTSTWSGDGPGGNHQAKTVYTTALHEFCSTGLRLHTYTITESCKQAKCLPRTGAPPGFTSTVSVCSTCGSEPITATLTVPCVEATPTGGPNSELPAKSNGGESKPQPQPQPCETCHEEGYPSESSVKPAATDVKPEQCPTCGSSESPSVSPNEGPQPPASIATSVSSNPSAEKSSGSETHGSAAGQPSVVTAGATKTAYGELGLLGIFGVVFILLDVPLWNLLE